MDTTILIALISLGVAAIGVTIQVLEYRKKTKDSHFKDDVKPENDIKPKNDPEHKKQSPNQQELRYLVKNLLADGHDMKDILPELKKIEPDTNGQVHQALRSEMITVLKDQVQPASKRCRAGNILSILGDPRFRSDAWCLPNDEWLGFVRIAAGKFIMGLPAKGKNDFHEPDQCETELPEFYINRYPITVAQFRIFQKDSGQALPSENTAYNDNHPMVSVSWYQAMEYCAWLQDQLSKWNELPQALMDLLKSKTHLKWSVSLPSEAEWEKAARGDKDSRIFTWGINEDSNLANMRDTGIKTTSPVGCFEGGCSPFGVYDMCGNVFEWTRTNWGQQLGYSDYLYPYVPSDGRENIQAPRTEYRILRGGSYFSSFENIHCSYRTADIPGARYAHVGFRLVITRL